MKYKECKSCENNNRPRSKSCKTCIENSNYSELYGADPNCKHEIISASGGGVRCKKCSAWFCF